MLCYVLERHTDMGTVTHVQLQQAHWDSTAGTSCTPRSHGGRHIHASLQATESRSALPSTKDAEEAACVQLSGQGREQNWKRCGWGLQSNSKSLLTFLMLTFVTVTKTTSFFLL